MIPLKSAEWRGVSVIGKWKYRQKNEKQNNLFFISEIKHFKGHTLQWHKRQKWLCLKIYIYIYMHTQMWWMDDWLRDEKVTGLQGSAIDIRPWNQRLLILKPCVRRSPDHVSVSCSLAIAFLEIAKLLFNLITLLMLFVGVNAGGDD